MQAVKPRKACRFLPLLRPWHFLRPRHFLRHRRLFYFLPHCLHWAAARAPAGGGFANGTLCWEMGIRGIVTAVATAVLYVIHLHQGSRRLSMYLWHSDSTYLLSYVLHSHNTHLCPMYCIHTILIYCPMYCHVWASIWSPIWARSCSNGDSDPPRNDSRGDPDPHLAPILLIPDEYYVKAIDGYYVNAIHRTINWYYVNAIHRPIQGIMS